MVSRVTLRRVLRVVHRVVAVLLTALALLGAWRLVVTPSPESGTRAQLEFLRDRLDSGSAEQAQRLFPEGHFFSWALYGLTWIELGQRGAVPVGDALREARAAAAALDSPAGRAPFDADLDPPYGVFHAGWSAWLLGGILTLDPSAPERAGFDARVDGLARAFDAAGSPFLPAYPGQAWPVDSVVAMAAVRLHGHLATVLGSSGGTYRSTVETWVAAARERLDPATGLLPHRADATTGEPREGARGTSQSIINRFLPEIDATFADEQYDRFRRQFVDWPLGLGPSVREHPHGVDGRGDVDSGPLVLGASLSATVVTLGAAQVHGDDSLASALSRFAEFTGAPVRTPSTKRYALGLVPIGDAFLAWSRTARLWTGGPDPTATIRPPARVTSPLWHVPLLAVLTLVVAAAWAPAWLPALARRRGRRAPDAGPDRGPDHALG